MNLTRKPILHDFISLSGRPAILFGRLGKEGGVMEILTSDTSVFSSTPSSDVMRDFEKFRAPISILVEAPQDLEKFQCLIDAIDISYL